jgi:hypothetical protein
VIDDRRTQPPLRARPVAELPVEAVLARAEELARRWIVALIRARPLEAIGALPLAALARDAPALCAQTVRAVKSDRELSRLTGAGGADTREGLAPARWISAVAGAPDAGATVQAVEALRGVLWEALLGELSDPTAREVGDIADRLAYVCAAALAVAVAGPGAGAAGVGGSVAERAPAPASGDPSAQDVFGVRASTQPAIVVDELARSPIAEHPSYGASPRMRAASIEIRDVRGAEGPAAWIDSIGTQLERFERDRLPFAVLLVELIEIARRSAGGRGGDWSESIERLERALADGLGSRGSLTRERDGRYWLVMGDTDRAGARQLAERVAASRSSHSASLEVAVGMAVCPEDGREASALAAHADVALYADRSVVRAARGRQIVADEPA